MSVEALGDVERVNLLQRSETSKLDGRNVWGRLSTRGLVGVSGLETPRRDPG